MQYQINFEIPRENQLVANYLRMRLGTMPASTASFFDQGKFVIINYASGNKFSMDSAYVISGLDKTEVSSLDIKVWKGEHLTPETLLNISKLEWF